MHSFQVIVAATRSMGIGLNGALPWHLPGDMKHFKDLTSTTRDPAKRNAVIMGRKTWESIPDRYRPLPGRLNVVLSRNGTGINGAYVARSFDEALHLLSTDVNVETVFVIGGGRVYAEAMESPLCNAVHLTQIDADYECDTFFPSIDTTVFELISTSAPQDHDGITYRFMCYRRIRSR